MNARAGPKIQLGMGLTELMVAMALGLMLIGVLFQVYLGSKRTFDLQTSLGARQETARFALHLLTRDLQMAGYRGCLRDAGTVRNTLNDAGSFLYDFGMHIEGFDAQAGAWSPALPASIGGVTSGTDVLTVRTVDDPGVFITMSMPVSSADLKTNDDINPAPLAIGDIALVTDCGGAAIFQVTNYTVANGNIVHNAGTGGGLPDPGNATKDLGRRFPEGSQVFTLRTTTYYIANSGSGTGPALWRRVGNQPAQELAEGVERMQVLYGEDTDADRVPNAYRRADQVTSWEDVTSVRVALLVASVRGRLAESDDRSFDLLGVSAGPFSDGRLRRVLTTTIALRNRLP